MTRVAAVRGVARRSQTKPAANTAPMPVITVAAVLVCVAKCAIRKTAPVSVRDMSIAATPKPVPALPAKPVTRLSTKLVS